MIASGSVERVRRILRSEGHADTIRMFPEGTRSAADAARAVGCTLAQIVKTLVFRNGDRLILILASGANRVDGGKVETHIGAPVHAANGRWVREVTGYAIGGVAPIGHEADTPVLIDEDLMELPLLWAAAGSPRHVFSLEPADLKAMTGGTVADIKED